MNLIKKNVLGIVLLAFIASIDAAKMPEEKHAKHSDKEDKYTHGKSIKDYSFDDLSKVKNFA